MVGGGHSFEKMNIFSYLLNPKGYLVEQFFGNFRRSY